MFPGYKRGEIRNRMRMLGDCGHANVETMPISAAIR